MVIDHPPALELKETLWTTAYGGHGRPFDNPWVEGAIWQRVEGALEYILPRVQYKATRLCEPKPNPNYTGFGPYPVYAAGLWQVMTAQVLSLRAPIVIGVTIELERPILVEAALIYYTTESGRNWRYLTPTGTLHGPQFPYITVIQVDEFTVHGLCDPEVIPFIMNSEFERYQTWAALRGTR